MDSKEALDNLAVIPRGRNHFERRTTSPDINGQSGWRCITLSGCYSMTGWSRRARWLATDASIWIPRRRADGKMTPNGINVLKLLIWIPSRRIETSSTISVTKCSGTSMSIAELTRNQREQREPSPSRTSPESPATPSSNVRIPNWNALLILEIDKWPHHTPISQILTFL